MRPFIHCTLSYRPAQFMQLASAVCLWATDDMIAASIPTVVQTDDGLTLLHVSFGDSPGQAGESHYFGYDEFNQEFVMYGPEECEGWSYELTDSENISQCGPMRFETIEAIYSYLTGQ